MNSSTRRATVAAIASSLLVVGAIVFVGVASPSSAATTASASVSVSTAPTEKPPRTLDGIKSTANIAITKRIAALDKAAARLAARSHLSDAHSASITAIFDADKAALTALNTTIQADTDRAAAAEHFSQIFTEYRIFAVVVPQAHFTAAADAIGTAAVPKLQSVHDKLAAALAEAPDDSTQAIVDDLQKQIDAAAAAVDGVADSALAVTPAAWNADHTVLGDERSSIASAVAAAKQARILARQAVAALR
jgi:hypothetical protein